MYNARGLDSEAAAADVPTMRRAWRSDLSARRQLAPENEFSKRARGRLMGLASATYYDEPEIQAH